MLQAIYDQDLETHSSTPLYTYIFAIRLLCEATPGSATTAEVLLHFDLTRAYPLKQPPNITVEPKHGLSDTETQKLQRGMEQLALEKLGTPSCTTSWCSRRTSSRTTSRTSRRSSTR